MSRPGVTMPQVDTMPPLEIRQPDFQKKKIEKIETPLDHRGLVDVPRLIEMVKATVDPSYDWSGPSNTHHFYWPESKYTNTKVPNVDTTYARFRDLPVHKGWMPVVFHNWLQHVTLPSPVPKPEAIAYRTESWRVAEQLFKRAQTQGFRYERKLAQQRRELLKENPELKREAAGQSKIAQAVMYGTLEQFFLDLDEPAVSQVRGLLSEVCAVEHIYDAKELAKGLGSVITGRSIELVPAVIEPIVA